MRVELNNHSVWQKNEDLIQEDVGESGGQESNASLKHPYLKNMHVIQPQTAVKQDTRTEALSTDYIDYSDYPA